MKIPVVKIGNSRGIRIPKPILEQCCVERTLDLSVVRGAMVLKAVPEKRGRARDGWSTAFMRMAAAGDDRLLDPGIDADPGDWTW